MNVICFHGGAKYFFWNIGVSQYFQKQHDISSVLFVGASAGALSAVLTICQIDVDKTLQSVEKVCQKYKVFERYFGLFGVWSSMVEEWLDMLLPENAHELCNDKVYIILQCLSLSHPKLHVSTFYTRKELIDCLLATIHIPFFMDYRPFRSFRGYWCYDIAFFYQNKDYEIVGDDKYSYHHIDFSQDEILKNPLNNIKGNRLQTSSLTELAKLIEYGYNYAKRTYSVL